MVLYEFHVIILETMSSKLVNFLLGKNYLGVPFLIQNHIFGTEVTCCLDIKTEEIMLLVILHEFHGA